MSNKFFQKHTKVEGGGLKMSVRDISHLRADVDCLKQKNDFFVFFGFHIFLPPRLGGGQNMSEWDTSVFF